MDTTQQRAILDAVARAAKEEGCLVAPVGSVYFLLAGAPRMTTKDVDIVIHETGLQPPSLDVLKRIAARLEKFGDSSVPDESGDEEELKRLAQQIAHARVSLGLGKLSAEAYLHVIRPLEERSAAIEARRLGRPSKRQSPLGDSEN